MGKMTRNGGSNHKDVVEEQPYVCHIITLPLREQTRRTRIAKRLENSKDKTEFWMPSLPWRCIEYVDHRTLYFSQLALTCYIATSTLEVATKRVFTVFQEAVRRLRNTSRDLIEVLLLYGSLLR